jgi:hypothetical protein
MLLQQPNVSPPDENWPQNSSGKGMATFHGLTLLLVVLTIPDILVYLPE